VAERVAHPQVPALVVTHGGSLRALLAAATGTPPPPVQNGAVWRVVWEGGAVVGAEPL
jgi:broad specificity phosphatase PhoE